MATGLVHSCLTFILVEEERQHGRLRLVTLLRLPHDLRHRLLLLWQQRRSTVLHFLRCAQRLPRIPAGYSLQSLRDAVTRSSSAAMCVLPRLDGHVVMSRGRSLRTLRLAAVIDDDAHPRAADDQLYSQAVAPLVDVWLKGRDAWLMLQDRKPSTVARKVFATGLTPVFVEQTVKRGESPCTSSGVFARTVDQVLRRLGGAGEQDQPRRCGQLLMSVMAETEELVDLLNTPMTSFGETQTVELQPSDGEVRNYHGLSAMPVQDTRHAMAMMAKALARLQKLERDCSLKHASAHLIVQLQVEPLGGLVGPQRGDLRFSSRDAYGEPGVPFRTFVNVAAVQAHCGGLKSDDQRQAAPAIPQLRPEFYCGAGKAGAWTFRKIPTLALIVRSANSSELPLRTSEEAAFFQQLKSSSPDSLASGDTGLTSLLGWVARPSRRVRAPVCRHHKRSSHGGSNGSARLDPTVQPHLCASIPGSCGAVIYCTDGTFATAEADAREINQSLVNFHGGTDMLPVAVRDPPRPHSAA